jgi:hypothetical protein
MASAQDKKKLDFIILNFFIKRLANSQHYYQRL